MRVGREGYECSGLRVLGRVGHAQLLNNKHAGMSEGGLWHGEVDGGGRIGEVRVEAI
jgi:hypothetical protein